MEGDYQMEGEVEHLSQNSEVSEIGSDTIEAVTIFENPYKDAMEERRLYLLDYYELMKNCVEHNLGMHPRMNSDEAMTECCGRHFRIMVHEFNQTMKRVAEMYTEILRHKFSLMGEENHEEVEEFLHNLKDFVRRDFQVKESLALSIRGAKLIVDEKLYMDLITASKTILQDLEEYRLELKRGRDNIMIGIRLLLEKRDEQIEEMLKAEEKAAKAALEAEERRRQELEEKERIRASLEAQHEDKDDRSGEFDESSEHSEESESHESEESGHDSDEDSEEEDSEEKGDNFIDTDNDDDSSLSSGIDYDALSSSHKIFDEFRDIDDEKKAVEDIHDGQIEEEWQRLKEEHKLDPRLAYVDGDDHLQEIDHSMKTDNL